MEFGNLNRHFTVPNDKITRIGNDTLTFTATPIRQINLTMPAPLTIGDPLPTTADVGGVPEGVTAQKLEWPYTTGATVPDAETVHPTLTLKTDGTRPILVNEYQYPTVNGEEYVYANNTVYDGSMVKVSGIALPVKPKGVMVSGTAVSWNDTDNAEYLLYDGSTSDADIKAEWKNNTYASGAALYTGTGGTISDTTVDGKAMKAQTFSFDTVAEGEYKLVIFKPDKYVPKIVSITVGTDAYDCGQLKLWLYGDVNYDGKVNGTDAVQIQRSYASKIPNVFSVGSEQDISDRGLCADVNHDGKINGTDAVQIQRYYANKLPNAFTNIK